MQTTMDAAGRLVIPSAVRRAAGLRPGMPLDVRWRDGHIEIETAPIPLTLRREGRFLVAAPQDARELPPLTADIVEQVRHELEHERGTSD
jgi:AbrB family looped-hinge helix DNA binding protein